MTRPEFRILSDGKDRTEEIRRRLLNLTIRDESGIASDSLQIHLFDDPPLLPPNEGSRLEVALGYDGQLFDVGVFGTRPVSIKGPPATMSIEASVLDLFPSLRMPKKRSWKPQSLKNIIEKLASDHKFQASIDPVCAKIQIPHEDQTESDAAFLARIAEHYECLFKLQRDHLILYDRDSGATPGGTPISKTKITRIIDYEFKHVSEPLFSGVKASWWDRNTSKQKSLIAGKEGRVHAIKFLLKDRESARDAAEAKLKQLKRKSYQLSFTVPGNPHLFAGGRCIIEGRHPLLNREWFISAVEHSIDNSGFISKISSEGIASP